jgi:hypothetical protein
MDMFSMKVYVQIFACLVLFVFSVFGIANVSQKANKKTGKMLIWIIGLLMILSSTYVLVESNCLTLIR